MNYACIRHNVSCCLSQMIEFNGISCKLSSAKHSATAPTSPKGGTGIVDFVCAGAVRPHFLMNYTRPQLPPKPGPSIFPTSRILNVNSVNKSCTCEIWNLFIKACTIGIGRITQVSDFLISFSIAPGWMQIHPSDRQWHWKITSTTIFPNLNRGFRVLIRQYNNTLRSSFLSDVNHVSPIL